MGQVGQVIPGTFKVEVCVAAQTGAMKRKAARVVVTIRFIENSILVRGRESVEESCDVGECERYDNQGRNDAEECFESATRCRQSADLSGSTGFHPAEDASACKEQRDQCGCDEPGAVGVGQTVIASPRPGKT